MNADENGAVVRRWFEEFFNERNPDLADELVAPDHTVHDPSHLNLAPGPEGQEELLKRYYTAFPDARIIIDHQIANPTHVATSYTFHGTHTGDLPGFLPTGVKVAVSGIQLDRISEGKIEESWVNWDTAGVLRLIEPSSPEPPVWPRWPPWG